MKMMKISDAIFNISYSGMITYTNIQQYEWETICV